MYVWLTLSIWLILMTSAATAVEFPEMSGLAEIDSGRYLLVSGVYDWPDNKDKPRLFQAIDYGSPPQNPWPIKEDWGGGPLPDGLQCVSRIPGRELEYLMFESVERLSPFARGGRVFHVRLERGHAEMRSKLLNVFRYPKRIKNDVKGVALMEREDGSLLIIMAENGVGPYSPAKLWSGTLDLNTGVVLSTDALPVLVNWPERVSAPRAEPITDLWLDEDGYLWASGVQRSYYSSTSSSIVYRLGFLTADSPTPITLAPNSSLIWHIDGFCVQALCSGSLRDVLRFGTADEDHQAGVWRLLPAKEVVPQS